MPPIDLPKLLPRAVAWAEVHARLGQRDGRPLDDPATTLATAVGVRRPDRIRVKTVDRFPQPDDAELRQAALATGLLGADGLGLTLGYTVLLRREHETDPRLLRHEFRHVQQYERLGSLAAFLGVYLAEIVQFGYGRAPLELDARAHETEI